MTLYDVLPAGCRANVTNKNVGNVPGDAYFMLKDKYLPLACAQCKNDPFCKRDPASFDCSNPESVGKLVVRQITVEVGGVLQIGTKEKPFQHKHFLQRTSAN